MAAFPVQCFQCKDSQSSEFLGNRRHFIDAGIRLAHVKINWLAPVKPIKYITILECYIIFYSGIRTHLDFWIDFLKILCQEINYSTILHLYF